MTTVTPDQQNDLRDALTNYCVTRAKREILDVMVDRKPFYAGGRKPPINISSFSDLHDFCDANELGGLCDTRVVDLGEKLFAKPGENDLSVGWCEFCNTVQNTIHQWLADGTMKAQTFLIRDKLLTENTACLLDPERNDEADGMLDDMECRLGEMYGFTETVIKELRTLVLAPEHNALVQAALGGNEPNQNDPTAAFAERHGVRPTWLNLRKAATRAASVRDDLTKAMEGATDLEAFAIMDLIGQAAALATTLARLADIVKE